MQGNWIQEVKNIDLFDCKEFKPDSMTETKMRPGYAAVLYHQKQSEIVEFHELLGVNIGIDAVNEAQNIPTYALYQDTRGNLHQLYSFLEKSDSENENCLPEFIADWIDRAEHTVTKTFTDSASMEVLVQAQCKTFQFKQELSAADYYDESRYPAGKSNIYSITYKIYAVHNLDDGTDYYLIEAEGMYPFSDLCADVYKKSVGGALSKIQEYYGGKITESCALKDKSVAHCHIERTSPQTTVSNQTINVGLDWNLGGSFSYSKTDGATGSISGGINVVNNKSYQVSDVTVSNLCRNDGNITKWEYDFAKTGSHFSFFNYGQVSLEDCALAARTTFISESEWILHISRDDSAKNTIEFEANVNVDLISSRARLDYPCHTACVHKIKTKDTGTLTLSVVKPPIVK